MNIFQMMRDGELHSMWFFLPLQMILIAVLCYLLAKDKRRNYKLAMLLGLVPGLNTLVLIYYVGISKLEASNSAK